MRLTVLGSGTFLPDAARGAPSHLIEAEQASFLLDCGASVLQALDRWRVDWRSLDGIFISHFHTDHVGGVAPLLFALRHGIGTERRKPLHILGPLGLSSWMGLLAEAHGPFVLEPGFPVLIRELSPGETWAFPGRGPEFSVHGVSHSPEALAVRVTSQDRSLGYTGDTGPHPELAGFMEDVHVLLSECAVPDPSPTELHLTPEGVAELARRSMADLVVTVHAYPTVDLESLPGVVRNRGFQGQVLHAWDGLTVQVGPRGDSRVLSIGRDRGLEG
jgi:ribonuclease BN (tRNA processing enzyme)